jgi:serine/threonine protein kinase/tetratricopeptide (TPR) repeat protein
MPDPAYQPSAAPRKKDLTGTQVGRFIIHDRLGSGGMGEVYRAEDTKLRRTVAIKRLSSLAGSTENEVSRLLREGQRASALNHPNIAGVYDVLEDNGEILLVMEYVQGQTLRERLTGPMKAEEFLPIAVECASALAAAHEKGILHSDIKPENIMLTPDGHVKLLDFGVARRVATADDPTLSMSMHNLSVQGAVGGTPAYMAPEILLGGVPDLRADVFSLGLVFHEMLSGRHPYRDPASTTPPALRMIQQATPPPLPKLDSRISQPIAQVITKCLQRDPMMRYSSAKPLYDDVLSIAEGTRPKFAAIARPSRRGRAMVLFALLAIAVAMGIGLMIPALRNKVGTFVGRPNSSQTDSSGPDLPIRKVLAVLPFQAQNADQEIASLGNGLVETLTAKMARLGVDHSLQVVSSSELRAKHVTRLDEVRQEFGATLGLQVSLQRSGDLVRVAYNILDAKSGQVLRANTMDTPLNDPFAIEDQVVTGIASALGLTLRPEERRELALHGTGSPEAYNYYLRGRGYTEAGPESADSAISLFMRALQLDPSYGLAEAELGIAYWSKYQGSKNKSFIVRAQQSCSKAVNLGNAGAAGHVCLGVLGNGTGDYENAIQEFTRAIQLDPSADEAYVGMASAYERLGKLTDAEKTYQRVIDLRPQYWKGYNLLGGFYFRQAQYDKCAAMFQKVTELTPESFRGYANLGAVYLADGKYSEAIQPLNESLRIRATGATYSNLGTAYFHLRRFSDSARIYTEAIHLNDSDYHIWGNLAAANYFGGDRPAADRAYRQAIKLAEDSLKVNRRDPEVLRNLADYYVTVGERARGLEYLDQALAYGKMDKEILFGAAIVYNRLGETGMALEWLRKALLAGYSLTTVRESPDFDNLRGDSRYVALLQQPPH